MMRRFLLALLIVAPAPLRGQDAWTEEARWGKYFDSTGVAGSLVLYDGATHRWRAYDTARARERFIPASTFKILNSLIALQLRAVASVDDTVRWDGVDRCIAEWNRDLPMREAIRLSAFWVYQDLARRVGTERMTALVRKARYGNGNIDGGIDRFWLDGQLRISAVEQIGFLVRLHEHQLPFNTAAMRAVEEILIDERGPGYVIRAKTGWARPLSAEGDRFADCRPAPGTGSPAPPAPPAPELGWWVGYVERPGSAVYFALNIDIVDEGDAAARKGIVRAVLRNEGVIP